MSLQVQLSHAFETFSLDLAFEAPGGITALFGRSGSGKTTIVNAVAGLLAPDAGRIVAGETVLFDSKTGVFLPPNRRRVGYVFQEARLFPHLSVEQNLRYGMRFAGKAPALAEFEDIAALLGIGGLLDRRPATLSGGERQRVAIGRALLSAPQLLLMDEPLASLDEARKEEILPFIARLRERFAIPVLYVSHSLSEVARLANTVVMLRDGKVALAGATETVLSDPQIAQAAGIREAGAILAARVVAHHDDGLTELTISAGRLLLPRVEAAAGAAIRIRIHANDVLIARQAPDGLSALNVLPARVTTLRRGEGPGMLVQLAIGEDHLLARITQRSADALGLAPGVSCHAVLKTVAVARSDVWGNGA